MNEYYYKRLKLAAGLVVFIFLTFLAYLLISVFYGSSLVSIDIKGLFYSTLGMGFGIYVLMNGVILGGKKNLIKDIPTSKIRSLAMGLVEICGEAFPSKTTVKGPLSGRECIYYQYKIEEFKKERRRSTWVLLMKGHSHEPFYLKDDTGSVLVNPNGADIDLSKEFVLHSGFNKNPPERIKDLLTEKNLNFEGFLGINKDMRYTEQVILPGDRLYIMGTAGDNPFTAEASAKNNVDDIMIQGAEGQVYHISDKSEKMIARNLRLKFLGAIIAGGIITVGAFLIFLSELKLF